MEPEWKPDAFGGSYREVGEHFCGCTFPSDLMAWFYAVYRDPTGLWTQTTHASEADAKAEVERRCVHA